jgi:predicted RNA-binding protein with RPS1 domain
LCVFRAPNSKSANLRRRPDEDPDFGALINPLPGVKTVCQTLARSFTSVSEKVTDHLKEGQIVKVKVMKPTKRSVKLSMKAFYDRPAPAHEQDRG